MVDDSVFARKNICKMVEAFGGEIAGEASDGFAAIAKYNDTRPDIVLMDITMPKMEGIEAVEHIVHDHPEACIVMVSSVGYQDNILSALQKGARHFVQKPVKPEAFYEIIRYVLSSNTELAHRGRGPIMNLELIQPFINSLDAVISETMRCSARIADVTMEDGMYQRTGVAALVLLSGDIEGRIILDMDSLAASQAASDLSEIVGAPSEETTREIICELTNMVIGNSVVQLNDRGYKFKVHPPELFLIDVGPKGMLDSETVLLRFELPKGAVYLNIAVHENAHTLVGSPA